MPFDAAELRRELLVTWTHADHLSSILHTARNGQEECSLMDLVVAVRGTLTIAQLYQADGGKALTLRQNISAFRTLPTALEQYMDRPLSSMLFSEVEVVVELVTRAFWELNFEHPAMMLLIEQLELLVAPETYFGETKEGDESEQCVHLREIIKDMYLRTFYARSFNVLPAPPSSDKRRAGRLRTFVETELKTLSFTNTQSLQFLADVQRTYIHPGDRALFTRKCPNERVTPPAIMVHTRDDTTLAYVNDMVTWDADPIYRDTAHPVPTIVAIHAIAILMSARVSGCTLASIFCENPPKEQLVQRPLIIVLLVNRFYVFSKGVMYAPAQDPLSVLLVFFECCMCQHNGSLNGTSIKRFVQSWWA